MVTNDFQLGDFDGDGIQDMIVMKNVRERNGYESFLYSYTYSNGTLVSFNGIPKSQWTIPEFSAKPFLVDYNGNGIADLFYFNHDSLKIYENAKLIYRRDYFKTNNRYFPGDCNGDGRTDLLIYVVTNNVWTLYTSTGSGFVSIENNVPLSSQGENYFIKDFNGDGKDDILEVYPNGNSTSTFNVYYSSGFSSFIKENYIYNSPSVHHSLFGFGDFNGDGKQDILYRYNNLDPYTKISMHENETSHLVSSITNGLNHVTKFSYKTLSSGGSTYTKSTGARFPLFDFQGPMYVVDNISVQNGLGTFNPTYYQYAGAKIHRLGKGFLGFEKVTSYNNLTGIRQENEYAFDNQYYLTYLKKSVKTFIAIPLNQLISTTNYRIGFHHYSNKCYFPYDSLSTIYSGQTQTTTTSSAVYETNGNLKSTFVNNNGLSTQTTVYNGYNNLGQPGSVTTTTTRTGETNYVTKDSFLYYNNGLLKLQITEPGNAKQVNTSYIYNDLGNITQVTTTSNGLPRRVVYYDYDTVGRMRIQTRNSAGHFTKDSCDFGLGVVLQSKDHNGLITTNIYDGFGRLTQTTSPDGIKSTIAYNWCYITYPNLLYSVTTTTPGKPLSIVYYDNHGREVLTEAFNINGVKDQIVQKAYNALGQLNFVTNFGINNDTIRYTYDYLGRVKTIIGPNVNTTYDYSGFKTTITDNIRHLTSSTESDATGLTKKSTDASGNSVEYTYNAQGQARQVNTLGSNITMGYDQFGRQTLLRDPNAGSNRYDYNNYGELTTQTDTLNRITSVAYDSLGRVTSKTSPDYNLSYYYNTNGLTDSVRVSNVSTIYEYDTYKRLKSKTERVKGVPLKTEFEYDTCGRISKKLYPSGFAVTYSYKNGYLEEIKRADNGTSIWKVNSLSTKGQVSYCTFGNGVHTNYQYNINNGALNHIFTGLGNSYNDIQSLDYYYNASGLLEQRQDNCRNRTLQEKFTYDKDNRLDSIKLNGTLVNNMEYKNNGAISYKEDVGNYTYSTDVSQLVRKTEYRGMIKPQQQSITYTSFNKTAAITEGSKTCSFIYGFDMERSYMETNIFGTITRKYYTDSYERTVTGTTTRELNYIFAYGQLVAIFVENGGADSMYYVHTDHLGSLNVITDQNGTIVNEISFDAWGNRRDPATWKNLKTTPTGLITSRGFTGHEHMDAFGLINMNGRVYDPVLASFLSPDNYVSSPDYSQAYNRYAYCMNNPLAFTDPTGDFPWLALAIFVVWMGAKTYYDGYKANNNNTNPTQWDWSNATYQVGFSTGGNGSTFSGGVGWSPNSIATFGYNTQSGFGYGMANNIGGQTNMTYPGVNYNAAEENAARSYDNFRDYMIWEYGRDGRYFGNNYSVMFNGDVTLLNTLNSIGITPDGLITYVNSNFEKRLPGNVSIKWQVWDEIYGITRTDDVNIINANLTVSVPRVYLNDPSGLLYDCIDHEIVHVNDYASGRVYEWKTKYGWDHTEAIMDYRAYSRNQWYSDTYRKGKYDYSTQIDKVKRGLPSGWR